LRAKPLCRQASARRDPGERDGAAQQSGGEPAWTSARSESGAPLPDQPVAKGGDGWSGFGGTWHSKNSLDGARTKIEQICNPGKRLFVFRGGGAAAGSRVTLPRNDSRRG